MQILNLTFLSRINQQKGFVEWQHILSESESHAASFIQCVNITSRNANKNGELKGLSHKD